MAEFYGRGDWLEALPSAAQRAIRERMVIRRCVRGDHLYRQGTGATGLFHVLSGFVQLRVTGISGNEMLVTIYGPGSVLGEIPLMSSIKRYFNAVVVGPAEIAELSRQDFDELAAIYPEIHQLVTDKLCRTIVSLLTHIEETSLLTLRQRLAKLLYSAGRAHGRWQDGQLSVELPLSQSDMGEILGVTRQSIHREMRHFQAQGLVGRATGGWVLAQPEQLVAIGNGDI